MSQHTSGEVAFRRIVDALHDHGCAMKSGRDRSIMASCPAHEDRSPSLHVTPTETRALLYCHAGCDTGAVVDALGLRMSDLYGGANHVEYRYPDRVVTRYTTAKTFRQQINSTANGATLLYLADKITAGATVHLVEGEEDVHAVEAAGGIGTTAPQGAANFHLVDVAPLAGAHVIAVVDRDESGDRWAELVTERVAPIAASLRLVQARTGKDFSDHRAAGGTLDDLLPYQPPEVAAEQHLSDGSVSHTDGDRTLTLVPASLGQIRRTRWLWDQRFPMGTIGLLAGPGGTGKSTVSYWMAAQITRGTLPGELLGTPRAVIVASAEDAWDEIIRPRLIAADADLARVYRTEVTTGGDLSLPRDLVMLEQTATRVGAALLILDPIISRLGKLDSHRDDQTRQALQPLFAVADRTKMAVLGLIHFNKSGAASDLLGKVMASAAFVNVARSVHAVILDPEDSSGARRLLGTPKNNMGRAGDDLPTLAFTIGAKVVGVDPDDGSDVTATYPEWQADSTVSIREAFQVGQELGAAGTQVGEMVELLRPLLDAGGGCTTSKQGYAVAEANGISPSTVKRAVKKMRLLIQTTATFPKTTTWTDPASLPGPK